MICDERVLEGLHPGDFGCDVSFYEPPFIGESKYVIFAPQEVRKLVERRGHSHDVDGRTAKADGLSMAG